MISEVSHKIKKREHANDKVYTPTALARRCISLVNISPSDTLLDPCRGKGAFYDNFPAENKKHFCEVEDGIDFFDFVGDVDWIISNPPYSMLDAWIKHTLNITPRRGFAYLLGINNLTARRVEMIEMAGYGLLTMEMFKVFGWFGMSAFCVFKRGTKSIIKYNRKVWRMEND